MSQVKLIDAAIALTERKAAVLQDGDPDIDLDSDQARFMVLGFDLDLTELMGLGHEVALYTVRRGLEATRGTQAAWMDGVLTGLMLAELRK